jgi:hypothetical protein
VATHFLSGLFALEDFLFERNPQLTSLPEDLFLPSPKLKRLSLSDNSLESIDAPIFSGLRDLRLLDMSGNNISQVSEISFPVLPNLRTLNLGHNPVRVVFMNAFSPLNKTESLVIGSSKQSLHIMKLSFLGLTSLRTLRIINIENDLLERDMFSGMTRLRELHVTGQVTSIGFDAFLGLKTLETLMLSQCRLQKLSMDSFVGLKSLQNLDLSSNQLTKLPPGLFDPLRHLRVLDLHDNALTSLPERLFVHLPLKSLRLDANPWRCSCDMIRWDAVVVSRVRKTVYRSCARLHDRSTCRSKEIRYFRDPELLPRCHAPEKYRGRVVFEVVRRDLQCLRQAPRVASKHKAHVKIPIAVKTGN